MARGQYLKEELEILTQYIAGGLELSLIVAIHFGKRFVSETIFCANCFQSNWDPKDPDSLHYIDPRGENYNEYMQAIEVVGSILSDYIS